MATKVGAVEIQSHNTVKIGVIGGLNLLNDRSPEEVSKNRLARHQLNSVFKSISSLCIELGLCVSLIL